jgi:hypothetical protein
MVASCHGMVTLGRAFGGTYAAWCETGGSFYLATVVGCATSHRMARRRIPQPTKHFRLILWFLLYRVHPQLQINREVEVIACQACRMPLCLFDRFKADFPHYWNQLLDKRSRRLAHLVKYGKIPDGWTPATSVDGRSGNYPYAALADRNKSTDSMIYLVRNTYRYRFAKSHPS